MDEMYLSAFPISQAKHVGMHSRVVINIKGATNITLSVDYIHYYQILNVFIAY